MTIHIKEFYMKKSKLIIIVFFLLLPFISNSAEDPAVTFKSMIKNIYNFDLATLPDEMKSSKSAEMDKFWELVETDTKTYLPLLRKELKTQNYNPFFYYDGTMLLLKLSQTNEDMALAVSVLPNAKYCDVNQYQCFIALHWIGCQGINTYPAIKPMIDTPSFSVFISEHSLTLDQDYSVLYCLLPIDEKYYLDDLIVRLKTEKDPIICKTLLTAIAYSVTQKGQDAIKLFIKNSDNTDLNDFAKPFLSLANKNMLPRKELTSKQADLNKFLNLYAQHNYDSKDINMDEFIKDAPYLVSKKDYELIKRLRNKQASAISDEALDRIGYLTYLMQFAFTTKDQ